MKKKIVILLLAAALCLTSCGNSAKPEEEKDTGDMQEEIEAPAETEEEPEGEISEGEVSEEEEKNEEAEEAVVISYEKESGESPKEDTEHLYTYEYERAVVTITGREEAAGKIQKSIDTEIENFLSYVSSGELGEYYEGMAEPAYAGLGIGVMRADEKVISLQFMNEGYNGGAHGWANVWYRNYFTDTGEEIRFSDLGADFRERALELVRQKTAQIQDEQGILFPDYEASIPLVVLDGTEDLNVIYASIYDWWNEESTEGLEDSKPSYYITEDSFVFVSGQYVLQPYAGGIVDIEIPREAFGEACIADIFF